MNDLHDRDGWGVHLSETPMREGWANGLLLEPRCASESPARSFRAATIRGGRPHVLLPQRSRHPRPRRADVIPAASASSLHHGAKLQDRRRTAGRASLLNPVVRVYDPAILHRRLPRSFRAGHIRRRIRARPLRTTPAGLFTRRQTGDQTHHVGTIQLAQSASPACGLAVAAGCCAGP